MRHRVAPHALVDLLALEHPAARPASRCSSSNSRRVRSTLGPPTKAWNWSARISSSPATSGASSAVPAARLRRRTTASTRAMTSSGWHGLVTQSSAPMRRPRTRWATLDWPGADDHAEARQRVADALEELPAPAGRASRGPPRRRAGASRADPPRAAGRRARRCCQPISPTRFASTRTKPVSESMTASRIGPGWTRTPVGLGNWAGAAMRATDRSSCIWRECIGPAAGPEADSRRFFTPIREAGLRRADRAYVRQRWRSELVLDRQAVSRPRPRDRAVRRPRRSRACGASPSASSSRTSERGLMAG